MEFPDFWRKNIKNIKFWKKYKILKNIIYFFEKNKNKSALLQLPSFVTVGVTAVAAITRILMSKPYGNVQSRGGRNVSIAR